MSLTTEGVWAANVWASTVWGDCVWWEPHCSVEAAEEVFSGGYEVYRYRPRVRFKFKDEEEKKAAHIVEQIIETQPIDTGDEELELILRLRLQYQEITFKLLYLNWLEQEYDRIEKLRKKAKKRREEDVIILLLH